MYFLKENQVSPELRSQNFLNFPPMMGGKFFKLSPQGLPHGGKNCPPRVSPMGGKFSRKTYFPPTHGGKAGSLVRDTSFTRFPNILNIRTRKLTMDPGAR